MMSEDLDLAAAVARAFYGRAPSAIDPLPSENNRVFRVHFAGLPLKVLKLGRRIKPCLREQQIVRALRREPTNHLVPPMEHTQDDLPASWTCGGRRWHRPATVSVFTCVDGRSLAEFVADEERSAHPACRAAGRFAAAERPVARHLSSARRRQSEAQVRRSVDPLRGLLPEVGAALDAVAFAKRRECGHLAHGEFYPENLLADAGGLAAVIDWETARPASPLSDLAQLTTSLSTDLADVADVAAASFFEVASTASRTEWRAWEVFWLLSHARRRPAGDEAVARLLAAAQHVWSQR